MKIKHIFIGLGALSLLAGCNDYLDVDAPSKYDNATVFNSTTTADKALNGVYATILVDNSFGNTLYNSLQLNSDVDFSSNANETSQKDAPRRFDMTAEAGSTERLWNALYKSVESANEFVYNIEHSPLMEKGSKTYADAAQMAGEAKVLRAMCLYELLCYYGDIPFTFEPTFQSNNFFPQIVNRDSVYTAVIKDLEKAAPLMKSVNQLSDGVERVSKEACWAMIARMALQAGGYSLRPTENNDYGVMERPSNYKDFYKIARAYADSVIESGTHSLGNSYERVFTNECNFIVTNNDDPIFEIPFANGANGQFGYYQGPTASATNGATPHVYGEANGGVRVEAFYRFTFDSLDTRRDYVNGLWYYSQTGVPVMRAGGDYNNHNNKWSKLWNTNGLGATSTGATGINLPYLRYADVLLTFAEAENELNGPTLKAQEALKQVRNRAFKKDRAEKVDAYVAQTAASKEKFLNAVLDERKWEFAGENMRWKDLVRNNKYAETLFYTFLRYYAMAESQGGSSQYMDMVEEHDGHLWSELPSDIYSCIISNPGDSTGVELYPNKTLPIRFIVNAYGGKTPVVSPASYFTINNIPYHILSERDITGLSSSSNSVTQFDDYQPYAKWWLDAGYPSAQILYSLYGYIRGDENGNISIVKDGKAENINPQSINISQLPPVRYLLPIPSEAITRSAGAYKQHYGY